MYSDLFLVGFPCLVAVFFFGWCVGGGCGACVSYTGIPGSSMPWALQYLWAIKLISWDFRTFSYYLEAWTGAPILTGTSGAVCVLCAGLGYMFSAVSKGQVNISKKLMKSVLNS